MSNGSLITAYYELTREKTDSSLAPYKCLGQTHLTDRTAYTEEFLGCSNKLYFNPRGLEVDFISSVWCRREFCL